jgi:hypothetical protein
MKRTLVTLLAGIAIGAAVVAAPALGSHHSAKRFLTMRIGDSAYIPSIDLFCSVFRNDADGHVTGPVVSCARYSTNADSWGVRSSRRWIKVHNRSAYVYEHARLP